MLETNEFDLKVSLRRQHDLDDLGESLISDFPMKYCIFGKIGEGRDG